MKKNKFKKNLIVKNTIIRIPKIKTKFSFKSKLFSIGTSILKEFTLSINISSSNIIDK